MLAASSSSSSSSLDDNKDESVASSIKVDNDDDDDDDATLCSTTTTTSSRPLVYPDKWEQLQRLAQRTSRDTQAVHQAQVLMDQLEEKSHHSSSHAATDDDDQLPFLTIDWYNLLWEVYAYATHLPEAPDIIDGQIQQVTDRVEAYVQLQQPNNAAIPSMITQCWPNLDSYAKLMDAYTQRGDLSNVEAVVKHLKEQASSQPRQSWNRELSLQPTVDIYNKLIRAHGMLGQARHAQQIVQEELLEPSGCQSLLNGMRAKDTNSNKLGWLRPNRKTWIHLLRALATEGRVDEIHQYMHHVMTRGYQSFPDQCHDWKPTVHAYNALIRAMILQHANQSKNYVKETTCHAQVEQVLYHMIQQSRRQESNLEESSSDKPPKAQRIAPHDPESSFSGAEYNEDTIRPNRETFFFVLQSYRGSRSASMADKVERLLELQLGLATTAMEGGRQDVTASWLPDTRTFNLAISIISRTNDSQKAVRAERLWNTMIQTLNHCQTERINDGNKNTVSHIPWGLNTARPNFATLRNVLNACAYTRGSTRDRWAAFQIAIQVYNQARKESDQTSSVDAEQDKSNQRQGEDSDDITLTQENRIKIYQLFLLSCFNLMPPSPKRDAVIERVFNRCCREGLLSNLILYGVVLKHASDDLQLKLLGGFVEDGVQPRAEWSRNVP